MNFWIFPLLIPLALGKLEVCVQLTYTKQFGLSGKIYVQLISSDKSSDWIFLNINQNVHFDRERIECVDLGDTYKEFEQSLNKLGFKQDDQQHFLSSDDGWILHFVSVCFNDVCKKFPFGTRMKPTTVLYQELQVAYICIRTSVTAFSGSDGNAFAKVFTSARESEWIPLKAVEASGDPMEVGSLDCFFLESKLDNLQINDAGQITKLGLKLQEVWLFDGWNVYYATVFIHGTCKKYFFNGWISETVSDQSEPC